MPSSVRAVSDNDGLNSGYTIFYASKAEGSSVFGGARGRGYWLVFFPLPE